MRHRVQDAIRSFRRRINFINKVETVCVRERQDDGGRRARGAGGPDTRRVFRASRSGSLFVGRSQTFGGVPAE